MFVRLTKLSGKHNPEWAAHAFGGHLPNLPLGYVAEGDLLGPIEAGKCLVVRRVTRVNDGGILIDSEGRFKSSPILAVREFSGYSLVDTENSTYKVEFLS
jgi:hypothetical protein